ncbi:hypothetical protein, partial [Bacillus pumilus]|uniref:hypothetical protein n=1 Tax=Bacillus pumilus TaxID=1408 RepID=UPI0021B3E44F
IPFLYPSNFPLTLNLLTPSNLFHHLIVIHIIPFFLILLKPAFSSFFYTPNQQHFHFPITNNLRTYLSSLHHHTPFFTNLFLPPHHFFPNSSLLCDN